MTPPLAVPSAAEIDVVYTWVDGSRPDYQAVIRQHATNARDLNAERFRDVHECLRYSLRSLDRYFPHYRNVIIFTARPQFPAWLNLEHPRLRVVHHDQACLDEAALPLLNSNVIERFLHLIPGISDRFIYFNDDYFLGAPTAVSDFFTPDGRIRIFGTVAGETIRACVKEGMWPWLGLLEHSPVLIDRREWAAALAAAPEFAAIDRDRFRHSGNLRPERLYRWHMLRRAQPRGVTEPAWRFLRYAAFVKLVPDSDQVRRALARLSRRPKRFFCLNDDQGENVDPASAAAVRSFLEANYPTPSSFERSPLAPSELPPA